MKTAQWTTTELIDKCLKRPADELAWQEFVRRFHAMIHTNVLSAFECKAAEAPFRASPGCEAIIRELVASVYFRLIVDDNDALRRFKRERGRSFQQYLRLISINIVCDYFKELHQHAPSLQRSGAWER